MSGWCFHRSASFDALSSAMWASGCASRSRWSAGVVITASPSQLTPRTRMRSELADDAGMSAEANLAHAILEILRALEDLDLDAHEIDGQIAPVDLRKADGVLLGRKDHLRLLFLAAVDGVEDFLLGKTVVVGETFRVDQVDSLVAQAVLEALGLCDGTERGNAAALDQFQPVPRAREDVLEVERGVDALDDAGIGIVPGDAAPKRGGVAVALGDENRVGSGHVRGRLAQRAARQQMLIAEGRLEVDQHDVTAATGQLPILEPVVQQQRVAPELLNRVAARLHTVFVHEHDDVAEVGRQHVRLV